MITLYPYRNRVAHLYCHYYKTDSVYPSGLVVEDEIKARVWLFIFHNYIYGYFEDLTLVTEEYWIDPNKKPSEYKVVDFYANCTGAELVGDAVYKVKGTDDEVRQATATDYIKANVVGFVVEKLAVDKCRVMSSGVFEKGGLSPGYTYFLSGVLGGIQKEVPVAPMVLKRVGFSLNDRNLYADVSNTPVERV